MAPFATVEMGGETYQSRNELNHNPHVSYFDKCPLVCKKETDYERLKYVRKL